MPQEDDPAPGSIAVIKETLHDQVASRIRDLIIEGRLEPGSRIDEAGLLASLGVSRTPFREALRTLAAEGLVVVRPSRGAVVRKLSPADVHSMLEVLAHLEWLAARLACARATDEEISALGGLHRRMLGLYERRDRLPYFKLNQEFHTRLVGLSRNETLVEVQGGIQARLKRIRFIGNNEPSRWAEAVAEHEEMATALAARDGDALAEVMRRHLENTWDRVKDTI